GPPGHPSSDVRGAPELMAQQARVTLDHAYWRGNEIYADVEGVPYLVDSGAEVLMTCKSLPEEGHLRVQLADGTTKKLPFRDHRFIAKANVARIKNDCGNLGEKYTHTIIGGVHPAVRQYPLNPGAVEEMDLIVRELSALGIIREELNPITNSPIQAVKKPESAGGGWRLVINFKALNRRTVANKASLINPQGTLKTLQVKKYKSCIDLANGFFSLRLARVSQGKTAFTHKERAYVWNRLPQGYKNSPNVFQSAVMDILEGLGVTVYIDDVFIADDTEEEHLKKLQQVVKRLTAAGLKLNLKKLAPRRHHPTGGLLGVKSGHTQ
uniref:ribonuclease H n=1 Tax=Stegastes partitus TaxID=144197 RepID=A0A3B5B8S8_9TELE